MMIADKLKERVLGKKLTEKELEHINPQFIESVSPLGGQVADMRRVSIYTSILKESPCTGLRCF